MTSYDAVVVGSGPNGLTAAARLARAGRRVLVLERNPWIGGGCRTEGFVEGAVADPCAAVHPFGAASPAFHELRLHEHGLRWVHPAIPLAHPIAGARAAVLHRSLDETVAALGPAGPRWRAIAEPLLRNWDAFVDGILSPLVRVPPHPLVMARFGAAGALPASVLERALPGGEGGALLAGLAGHSCLPLRHPFTAGLGLSLGLAAHAVGWPVAEGGSGAVTAALASVVTTAGGDVVTGHEVRSLADLPPATATLLDVTPRQLLALAGDRLSGRAARPYLRFRYGAGACRVDYLLEGPMPWTAAACRRAGTVHVGGTFAEVAAAEAEVAAGRHAERPFLLVAQPSLPDPTRAPAGKQVLWVYCHVPNGSTVDASPAIEAQLDRFAPGWRDLVVAKRVRTAMQHAADNPNAIGGDISAGTLAGIQLVARPRLTARPYATPMPGVWLCSASTPPGPGVHGMAGWHAAGDVLDRTS